MKKLFIFLLAGSGLAAGAGAAQISVTNIDNNWLTEIRTYLDRGDVSHGRSSAVDAAQTSTSKPETLALIAVGLIGLGIKRRQQS